METYRDANIFIRGGRGQYTAEYSWLTSKSVRIHGGSATHRQVAIMKAKATIDAQIAADNICNRFFRMKLIEG